MIGKISEIFFNRKTEFKEIGKFPEKGTSDFEINSFLSSVVLKFKNRKTDGIGDLYNLPNKIAVFSWQKLLPYNPGYLGLLGASSEEKDVIGIMTDLFKGNSREIAGYITSGATEGNIYSCWLGRKFLEAFVKKEQICLLRSDLTHFSIRKAADITGIKEYIIETDEDKWNIDVSLIEATIKKLSRKGYRGFIIPFTLGYTVGGTNDDFMRLAAELKRLEKKFNVYFFTWVDAALSGLTYPFLNNSFKPFADGLIKTVVVDFHKFAGIPYPAGIILYRKELTKLIKKDIPYLKEKDDTLLGSRTGISAVAILATIRYYGKEGFRKIINDCLIRKNSFISSAKKQFPDIIIKTDPQSVNLAILSKKTLPKKFSDEFGLMKINYKIKFKKGTKMLNVYKLFFLPNF